VAPKNFYNKQMKTSRKVFSVMSSRGCLFNCNFCDKNVFGRSLRLRGAENVVDEIEYLKSRYNAAFISFEDDNFLADKNRVLDLCDILVDRKVDISWACSARVSDVDSEILKSIKDAGCEFLYVGIESGSDHVLSLLNKHITVHSIKDKVKLTKSFGVGIYASFIIGTPFDTKEIIKKTIELSLELPLDAVSYNLFIPYPNTPIRNICEEKGTLSKNWRNYLHHSIHPPYVPEGMSANYLLGRQLQGYIKFYSRPRNLFNLMNSFAGNL
jgi:radical SAM superfamily enzyme YgiQ (UPF0313 family)